MCKLQSNPIKQMNEYVDHAFWKENIEDRVKLLGSNVLNCRLKITKWPISVKEVRSFNKMRE